MVGSGQERVVGPATGDRAHAICGFCARRWITNIYSKFNYTDSKINGTPNPGDINYYNNYTLLD